MHYQIPDPILHTVHNETPFTHFQGQKMGFGRIFYDCVVVKGTFRLEAGIAPIADEQAPIVLADEYHDATDATRSSIARAGELHLAKPGVDVLITGTAEAPLGRPTERWLCQVIVQDGARPVLEHGLEATGPRRWTKRMLGGLRLSEPEPTLGTPIRYELAYGGYFKNPKADEPAFVVHKPNPCGTGFFDEGALDRAEGTAGPQWELPGSPVAKNNEDSPLAGFGPVARMWASRLKWAGTYDDAWEKRVREDDAKGLVPDYPADFDPRFFHSAHPALIAPTRLSQDVSLRLRGLLADAPDLTLRLQAVRPRARALHRPGIWKDHPMPLDTLHVDLDARRVHAVWRLVLDPREDLGAVMLEAEEGAAS